MTPTDWAYIRRHAWRFQGGPQWSREMTPIQVFLAQSYATGFPRLWGLVLQVAGDAIWTHLEGPLLRRSMRGHHLGLDAHPLSITAIAGKLSGVLNRWRWTLSGWAVVAARYNNPAPNA